jgi:hypothetical protein
MPVRKVKGGYRWGTSGKTYATRTAAESQGRAIQMAMKKKKKKKGGRRG